MAFINMASLLSVRGHSVEVLALNVSQEFNCMLKESGVKVTSLNFKQWHLPYLDSLAKLLSNIKVAYLFRKFIKKNQGKYEIAFVHHSFFSPLSLLFFNIPTAYYCPEPPRNLYESSIPIYKRGLTRPLNSVIFALERLIDKLCVSRADKVIANSEYTSRYIRRVYGIDAVTVYPGVDIERFRKIEGLEKENIVLSVGPLHPMKAHDFVIRGLSKISEDIRPKLVICGKGSIAEQEKMFKFAYDYGVELEIGSGLDTQKIVELYNRAILTAVVGLHEPFGLSAVESMACQTPVVAIGEGGVKETVTEEVGILVNRKEEDFAKAVEYSCRYPRIAEENGLRGRNRVVEHFVWQKTVGQLEENLNALLRGPQDDA